MLWVKDPYIVVDVLVIKDDYRGKGYASALLSKIIEYCQLQCKDIVLVPVNLTKYYSNSLSYEALFNWYFRWGFTHNKDYPIDSPYPLIYKVNNNDNK